MPALQELRAATAARAGHASEWSAPAPLWEAAAAESGRPRFRRPAILRFASDAFMDELAAALAAGPAELAQRVARPETWRAPGSGWEATEPAAATRPLKLFQPVHGRFYLAAASLVCRRVGLPPRKVDAAAGERVSVVVRRLVPAGGGALDPDDPASFVEHAWIGGREEGAWMPAPGAAPLDGEERLPMFPLPHRDAAGRPQRLWAALVPVSGREAYEGAAPPDAAGPPPPAPASPDLPPDPLAPLADPRKAAWTSGPWEALRTLATPPPELDVPAAGAGAEPSAIARDLMRFALADLAELLRAELPALWQALEAASPAGLAAPLAALWNRLAAAPPWGVLGPATWRAALLAAEARRDELSGLAPAGADLVVPDALTQAASRPAAQALLAGTQLQAALFAAFDATSAAAAPASTTAGAPAAAASAARAQAAAGASAADGAFYRLRCVYERPRCKAFAAPVVSEPSRPFRLASFFDPDAPARALTIRLPLDTSIKGLRRFPKGVSMLVSNQLRQQVERVRSAKLQQIDDQEIPDGGPSWDLGMICSLSIPIITLCAFIVLMIFIQLLNIVFWWLPFFRICLPIPVRSE